MKSLKKQCPESRKIELLILQKPANEAEYYFFTQHLQRCKACKELFSELRAFYNVFYDILQKPVYNHPFRLIQDLEKDKINVAAILLKPLLLDEKPGERLYTSELILSTHLEPIDLDELDCIPLNADDILIRVIQSIQTHETTLFLFAENKKLYSEVTLKIHKIKGSFKSDKKGKIEVGLLDIASLDNQEIMVVSKL